MAERVSSERYKIEIERMYFAGVVCNESNWGCALLYRDKLTRDKKIHPISFHTGTVELLSEILEKWDKEFAGGDFAEHKHGLNRIIANRVPGFEKSHPLKASFPIGINHKSFSAHPVGLIQKWSSDRQKGLIEIQDCDGINILKAEINKGILSSGSEALLLACMHAPHVPQQFVSGKADFV